MAISEVSLMVRSGYKDRAIIAEIERRHVPEKPDAKTESSLLRSGASPALIQALKMDVNVLTPNQKEAFDHLAAEHANRAEQDRVAQEEVPPERLVASEEVVKRTVQNIRDVDAYKVKKEALENQINSQETRIRHMRANGYKEAQLEFYNQTLEGYRQQLRDLKPGMR